MSLGVYFKSKNIFFVSNIKLLVGNGQRVRFWEDCWIKKVALCDLFPRLYRLSRGRECSIASMFKYSIT